MRITILSENRARKRGVRGEHGLSLLVEAQGRRILFDAGQSELLLHNAAVLETELSGLDAVVLSHGHYDHAGGIPAVCRLNPGVPLYLGADAFGLRYNAVAGEAVGRPIGIPWERERLPETTPVVLCREPLTLFPGMMLSGPTPRLSGEASPSFLRADAEGHLRQDPVAEECFLALRHREGIVVVTGCSHGGILSSITQALSFWWGLPLRAVIGGFHLEQAGPGQLETVLEALSRYPEAYLYPLHCTGQVAAVRMKDRFQDRCGLLCAGDTLTLEEA